jgi:hypothetical protein
LTLGLAFIHVHSMRLATGQEVLVARALARDGKTGYGFSFQLDAAEARRMAEWHAGMRAEKPRLEPVLGHPWETAYVSHQEIPWDAEPAFGTLKWLSA